MFSTLGLFKRLPCPVAPDCSLEACLFSHDLKLINGQDEEQPPPKKQKMDQAQSVGRHLNNSNPTSSGTNASLRQGDGNDSSSDGSVINAEIVSNVTRHKVISPITTPRPKNKSPSGMTVTSGNETGRQLSSVSPPKLIKKDAALSNKEVSTNKAFKKELLQPRNMSNPPATHPLRFKLLLLIHEQLVRLNKLVVASKEPSKEALILSDQEIITTALDEEQNSAIANSKVYTNVMKNRISALKKSDLKAWIAERNVQIQKKLDLQQTSKKRKSTSVNERIDTGLSYEHEKQILPQLVTPINGLESYGYVTSIPPEKELDKARAGISAAQGWEVCDRCGCRFRVFPTRQDDGTVTTGGSCRHHWGRLGPQPRSSGAKPVYSCCHLEQGQPGCDEKPCHVFKVSNPQRLATIIPFEATPIPESNEHLQPVCFDCEMGYTSYGMELIRLTAAAWPSGERLLDVLVRPKGEVLDLNTQFSGVSIQQWTQARPWNSLDLPTISDADDAKRLKVDTESDVSNPKPDLRAFPIVPSPQHARSLLFKFIDPTTPLIGHALENDLIAVRIIHPTIIDTVLLYPHKRGLPMKNKLKFLVRDEIQWNIQDSATDGHDSLEDAVAAGELVRHKLKAKWEVLKRAGWSFTGDKLQEPKAKT